MLINNMTLYDYFTQKTAGYGNYTAVIDSEKRITSRELNERINGFAGVLKQNGVKVGNTVTLMLASGLEFVTAFYALSKIGADINILHSMTGCEAFEKSYSGTSSVLAVVPEDFKKTYADINVKCISVGEEKCAAQASEKCVRDNLLYLHGGGTTGESRTAVISSSAFNSLAHKLSFFASPLKPCEECALAVLPVFHAFGLGVCVHFALCAGYTVIALPHFNASDVVSLIKKENLTFVCGVPDMFRKLLASPGFSGEHLKKLRLAFSGGAPTDEALIKAFNETVSKNGGRAPLLAGYGLTEASGVVSANTLTENKSGSVGRPVEKTQVLIIDENGRALNTNETGEICISSSALMNGYFNGESPFFEHNGVKFLHTGDIGRLDKDGYLYITGRKKRMFIVSGYNVYPEDIENEAQKLKTVSEACAVESVLGGVKLYVSLADGEKALQTEQIKSELEKVLPFYSVPREIEVLCEIPHTVLGKKDFMKLKG